MSSECVLCGSEIKVAGRICCYSCRRSASQSSPTICDTGRGIFRGVSRTYAKRVHGLSDGDVNFLRVDHYVIDRANKKVPVYLYSEAEVAYLGRLRKEFPNFLTKEALAKKRLTLIDEKRREIEERLGRPMEWLTRDCFEFLVGDYLSKPNWTNRTKISVLDRIEIAKKINLIVAQCGVEFENAYRFCKENPNGGSSEFEELRMKTTKVFRLEGNRILDLLEESERLKLLETPMGFAVQQYRRRQTLISEEEIRELSRRVAQPEPESLQQVDGTRHLSESSSSTFEFATIEKESLTAPLLEGFRPTIDPGTVYDCLDVAVEARGEVFDRSGMDIGPSQRQSERSSSRNESQVVEGRGNKIGCLGLLAFCFVFLFLCSNLRMSRK